MRYRPLIDRISISRHIPCIPAPLGATTHAPRSNHTCPPPQKQPRMPPPGATMHDVPCEQNDKQV